MKTLQIGDKIPSFNLKDQNGKLFKWGCTCGESTGFSSSLSVITIAI